MNRYLFAIIIAVIFFACAKENSSDFFSDPNNPLNDTAWRKNVLTDAPVNNIFQILSTPPQTDSFDAGKGDTLYFDNNLQIIFPENSCREGGGGSISGTIKVEVNYLKTRGDMIRFGKPTMSGDKLLISGGAFNIKVTQNAQPLQLGLGKYFIMKYRNFQTDSSMSLFYGDTTVNNVSSFTWVPSKDSIGGVRTWKQTYPLTSGYEIFSQKFNWINCDRFTDTTSPRTTLSAVLPVNFTNNNTAVFLVFKDILSVAQMNTDMDNHLFYYNNVPVSSNAIIVSISKIGDDLYLGAKEAAITANLVVELSPEKKIVKEITDYLNSL